MVELPLIGGGSVSDLDEDLDRLIRDRFGFGRDELVHALRTLPVHRSWAARLTDAEARLLDDAGFTEDPDDRAEVAASTTARMARLYSTAYPAAEVAAGLGVSDSRVRQLRLAHTLWAIDDGGSWVFPVLQFELIHRTDPSGREVSEFAQLRGLDKVFPHLLTRGLHPLSVAGFLESPQPELQIAGRPQAVREWLRGRQPVEPVLRLLEVGDWAA
ncbi:DNA-binding protein [Gordonia sp. OPL2]|uniref:DNA-binding protein n=1 Tax=Gordonia sp. OPL2 TaxID=2486274 RepID=UPI001655E0E9|nr:DNA-binding protein [Gordonia sp. OPL2]ROZ99359.1 DNA-binding protein [Gordonia sp. OPL2]